MSIEAHEALEWAQVVVGYKTYISLIEGLIEGKRVISTGMRGEIDRCKQAIKSALAGERTVVVCSGDSGIYGLSGLILELLDRDGVVDKVTVEIIPGIPAFVAASSLLGAPLMHDFVCISLSDLLTPWDIIEERIRAAGRGDFVVVLYNPRSRKRKWQLSRCLEILREYRDGSTVVGIVQNAMREGENTHIVHLGEVDVNMVDMFTILIVGNSSTYVIGNKMVTSRGYMEKYGG